MIPSAFVPLACLPMTRSGKIDRRRLPEPPRSRAALEVPYAAPRNPLESVLARLWCEVLQLDAIGCDDDLAALGGDSLLATRIVMQVNQMFNLTRPLKTLFATPTVAQLAAWIAAQEYSPGAAAQTARLMLEIDALTPEQIYRALSNDDLPKQNG
jgi:acyl carrier protein